jgi:hypothetical protein
MPGVVDVPVVVEPAPFVVADVDVVVAPFVVDVPVEPAPFVVAPFVVGTVAVAEPAPEPVSPLRSGVVAGSGFSASSSVFSAGWVATGAAFFFGFLCFLRGPANVTAGTSNAAIKILLIVIP